ncbi:MAG: PSD1 and planctomycete cytochrome C domain-containing protein [Pirellulales bacterium]|nr:PSD1 and planctomycete cytochrome C domain-containing protein [Pirellulales bacterium]
MSSAWWNDWRMGWVLALLAAQGASCLAGETLRSPSYDREVRPLLAARCFKCHGPAAQEGGLRLDEFETATGAGDSGRTAVVPANSAESLLVARVSSGEPAERMPPLEAGEALAPEEIDLLRRWIDAGAAYEVHWAYRRIERPPVPEVHATAWPRGAIDRFVLAKIEAAGMSPEPEAGKATLLRRVSLDLVGLPPTSDELQAFLSDDSADAYERVVERLLASPQFGVRQAQLWLDLARYADSDGYAHDFARTIWPYRDWVVDALNADLPFDQFTLEQLAGDLLPNPSAEQLIATGFHRNTRINVEAGSDPEEYRLAAVFDRVTTTATVWLGSTLACAQCHHHKYDPFRQEDFYRLAACFNQGAIETTRDESGKMTDVSPRLAVDPPAAAARRAALEARLAAAHDKSEQARLKRARDAVASVQTLVMRDQPEPRTTHVLLRGNPLTPGDEVAAGPPQFLIKADSAAPFDRLALARWLTARDNPLAARVQANRIWAQYFGTGLVATPEDFGAQGAAPSHPELLDWLAVELLESPWRLKQLHRLIVTSATYRQAASSAPAKQESDPENRLLARASRWRLPAELVRDNALAIGGLLHDDLGGPAVQAAEMNAAADAVYPYRRSLYVFWKRQALDDTFVTFDAPTRDVTCPRREATRSPLQALALLNDRVFVDAAVGLARRVLVAPGTDGERIDRAMTLCVARPARAGEAAALVDLLARRRAAFAADGAAAEKLLASSSVPVPDEITPAELAAWTLVANVLLNLDETMTRE